MCNAAPRRTSTCSMHTYGVAVPLPCQSQSKERARPSACVRERNHIPHVRVRAQAGAGPFRAAVRTQSSSVVSRIGLGRTDADADRFQTREPVSTFCCVVVGVVLKRGNTRIKNILKNDPYLVGTLFYHLREAQNDEMLKFKWD